MHAEMQFAKHFVPQNQLHWKEWTSWDLLEYVNYAIGDKWVLYLFFALNHTIMNDFNFFPPTGSSSFA